MAAAMPRLAATRAAHFSRGSCMHSKISEVAVGSGDPLWPLRFVDARFEPHDPVFDLEPMEEPRPRRGRRAARTLAAALITCCGGAATPAIHTADAVLVHLEEGAAPPAGRPDPDKGPPIVALESIAADGESPVLRVPVEPGDDAV